MNQPSSSVPATPSSASLVFVFLVVFVDMVGFGIIMPVLPSLIVNLTGDSIGSAAVDAGWLAFAYALMQFVFGPIVGNLSDRFGRRPILLGTLVGYAIGYALMGFSTTLLWLFVARIVTGIMGASFSAAYAYIADISDPAKRAQNFGLIGMAFGLGFIIGPALGGLLGEIGTRLPFFAASGLAIANACFGFLFLKESLVPEKRRRFSWLRSNTVSALKSLSDQNRVVLWYAASLTVWMIAHFVFPIIWAFYAIEAFGWSERMIGLSLACVGLSSAIVQGGLIRIIVPRIGEENSVILGVLSMIGAVLIYVFATEGWVVFIAIAVGSFQGLIQPSINGLMSRAVTDSQQGELQGAVASLNSVAAIVGPPLFTYVFAMFTLASAPIYLPGAPFAIAGIIALLALALFLRGNRLHHAGEGDAPPEPA